MDQSKNDINIVDPINFQNHVGKTICERNLKYNVFSIFLRKNNPFESPFTIVLLQISIVLALNSILSFLLKPLKQTTVVCGVLAGIILGPSFLGHSETFEKYVIPDISKFLIRNIGIIGFMFYMFLAGVKIDLTMTAKAGKKVWVLSLVGTIIPILIIFLLMKRIKEFLDPMLQNDSYMWTIPYSIIFTPFQVLYFILLDMNLISSEIGRLALNVALINDLFALIIFTSFEATLTLKIKQNRSIILKNISSIICIISIIFIFLPPVVKWINKSTPEGKPVNQNFIVAILLTVFVIGFCTDSIGAAMGTGPLWLGLIMPNKPPMGADIMTKTEVILNHIFMPFVYASIGLKTNIFAMAESWNIVFPSMVVVSMAIFSRLVTNVTLGRFVDMSYRDSFIMSIMLSLRGQPNYFLCLHFMDLKIIQTPTYSLMVILITLVTAISCPIINYMYDPTKMYLISKNRTIERTMKGSELRILACIYDQESAASLFNLLDFANPTSKNPFAVFTLYLIDFLGRGNPMFIEHEKHNNMYWDSNNEVIHSAIKHYAAARTDCITMRCFTSVTPNHTMYQDICEISLKNKVSFIILPFHKKSIKDVSDFSSDIRPGVQLCNAKTLLHAPCSVGILACRNDDTWGKNLGPQLLQIHRQFVMLFLGGSDAREALSFVSRMVEHPNISLIVIRFLSSENKGYNKLERKMDDGMITRFWIQNELNDKVVYKEVFVNNGLDTISVIQSLTNSVSVDLWIVGRENGIIPSLLEGLSDWSENPELGILGDFLVSMEVNTSGGSVLVVQQQMLRNAQCIPWGCC